ncbi:dTDP-4-dehydrorhamnose reductase [Marinilabiliaceae bacterium ANBcel2]|nr:dTDP-4-dehydrorhamnose reductase [Marinilabiliaceae bacterium ANBcel2]
MQILIIGGEGQLGNSLKDIAKNESFASFTITQIEELNLSKESNVESFLTANYFDYIVNTAAYTNVDKAEEEKDIAKIINSKAPGWIGKYAAKDTGIIQISTDYVFDGSANEPLSPDIKPNPCSVYGKTKLKGEENLLKEHSNSAIIRTSWLYSQYGGNFVKTMLNLGSKKNEINVVFDQIGTPTYAEDLAKAIIFILKQSCRDKSQFIPGIYHYSNEGVCSWYDFAHTIFNLSSINCKINPVLSDMFPTKAPRPSYSVMDKTKIKESYHLEIPHWYDSIKKHISTFSK